MVEAGVSMEMIAQYLGHDDVGDDAAALSALLAGPSKQRSRSA